ncbi:hypothetical protein [Nonomuraea polychroma]|uniref:hypothetical protein n=1 Tax=Nonomuraea polychroma TaxID=46176 RepID=UPI0019D43624|nr:hypothetical protein [Nonomuraea polychroma]
MASLGTFVTGYLARPVGGVVFGHFGDRLGRKRMLVLTMVVTGEVRPAVARAVLGMSPLLATVFTIEMSSTSAALAVIALAGWGAVRARQGRGPGRTAGEPVPREDV